MMKPAPWWSGDTAMSRTRGLIPRWLSGSVLNTLSEMSSAVSTGPVKQLKTASAMHRYRA
jgi:hypothetical protein